MLLQKTLFFALIILVITDFSLEELKENSCYSLTMWLQKQKFDELERAIAIKPNLDAVDLRNKLIERAYNHCIQWISDEEAIEISHTSLSKQARFGQLVPVLIEGLNSSKDIEIDFKYTKKRRELRYRVETGGPRKKFSRRGKIDDL
ncbi:unnamed protein product [Blepharisma stoltei]|uniref:Uncharacterized protein n=1 Tax=Blepharisma stoltei TaxID=1481888 RepID=A0AAU9JLG5_9CILI|nr:unnamed protein product [Blepharisma stoltei]